jgi:hypothetical protein
MLGSDDGVASCRSEFVGLAQEFFDLPGEFSHGRIMTGRSGTFPNTGPSEHTTLQPISGASSSGKTLRSTLRENRGRG